MGAVPRAGIKSTTTTGTTRTRTRATTPVAGRRAGAPPAVGGGHSGRPKQQDVKQQDAKHRDAIAESVVLPVAVISPDGNDVGADPGSGSKLQACSYRTIFGFVISARGLRRCFDWVFGHECSTRRERAKRTRCLMRVSAFRRFEGAGSA